MFSKQTRRAASATALYVAAETFFFPLQLLLVLLPIFQAETALPANPKIMIRSQNHAKLLGLCRTPSGSVPQLSLPRRKSTNPPEDPPSQTEPCSTRAVRQEAVAQALSCAWPSYLLVLKEGMR